MNEKGLATLKICELILKTKIMKSILLILIVLFCFSCKVNRNILSECKSVMIRDTITISSDHIHFEGLDGPLCHYIPGDTVLFTSKIEGGF